MKKSYKLSLFSGLLLGISFPPLSFLPFILIAIVPLLIAIRKKNLKQVFQLSFISFFIFYSITMYWILFIQVPFAQKIIVSVSFVLVPLFMSIPIIICKLITNKSSIKNFIFLLPLLWTGYEFLQNYWESGVSWTNIGYGLSAFPFLMQFYSLTGIIGGGLIIILINVLIYHFWTNKKKRRFQLIILTLLTFIGVNSLIYFTKQKKGNTIKITIIQPNINPYEKLNEGSLYNQIQTILQLTNGLRKGDTDLVVCPEGMLRSRKEAPIILNNIDENPAVKELKRLSLRLDAPIITGLIGLQITDSTNIKTGLPPDDDHIKMYNTVLLIAHDTPVQINVKQKLAPMMEKVPLSETFPVLKKLKFGFNQSQINYSNDRENKPFEYRNFKIASLICYDAVSTYKSSQLINQGTNLIVVISNDGWAGKTSGYIQNSNFSKALAVQHNVSVVRSANTGRSSFINPYGEELSSREWNVKTSVTEKIPFLP